MKHTEKGKKINLLDSIFLGIGGTSPALSIAAVAATLIGATGNLAPASIFYSGIMIFGIALSFIHLNKLKTDDGASFTWVTQIFGKTLGFLSGWAVMLASVIYLVSAATPAASGVLGIIDEDLTKNNTLLAIVGVTILTIINLIILRGLRFASKIETFVTSLSLITMVALIVGSLYHFILNGSGPMPSFPFLITAFTKDSFVSGTLIAIFFFWGWDVAMNVGEETNGKSTGATKSVSTVVLVVAFLTMLSMMAIYVTLPPEQIAGSGANVIFDIANIIFPAPFGAIAVITILLSSIGAIEASVLQFIKTLFSMSKAGSLHPRYQAMYKKWNSPWLAILIIWAASSLLFVLSLQSHSAAYIIGASVNAICLQVAFYYSMTGFACAWHYRKETSRIRAYFLKVIWPLFSAVFLVGISAYSMKMLDVTTITIGVGSIVFGLIPFFIGRKNYKEAYQNVTP